MESMAGSFLGVHASTWLAFGQSGVDVFFVISGFIIVYVTPRPLASLRDLCTYLFRRMARIYPAYWAITLPALAWRDWKGTMPHDSQEVLAWIFLLPYRNVPPIIVAWTLVYEIHFYIICAAILFLSGRFRIYAAMIWLLVIIAANFFQINLWNLYTGWWLAPYPLEFIAGMLLAHWATHGSPIRIRPILAAILVGSAYMFMMIYVHKEGFFDFGVPAISRMFILGLPALMIVQLVYQMETQGDWRWMKRFVPIGDRSYSIYLLHFPVLVFVFGYMAKLMTNHTGVFLFLSLLIFIGILMILVELSYRLIERPCQQMAKRLAPHTELTTANALHEFHHSVREK